MTEHFSLSELIASDTAKARGIDNTPGPEVLPALQATAEGLERVRALAGHPLKVLSAYRCVALNRAVGGAFNSQHVKGEAADIICSNLSVHDLAMLIFTHAKDLGVDQVIKEKNRRGVEWVHVSFTSQPRHMALTWTPKGFTAGIV